MSGNNTDYNGWTVYPPNNQPSGENVMIETSQSFSIIYVIKGLQILLAALWLIIGWLSIKMMKRKDGTIN
jgi:hypothetical protein